MVLPMFDTYRAVNALKEAGFADEQAVAVVDTIGGAMTGGLATKADLAEVKADLAEMKAGLAEVKAELKGDLAAVKADVAEFKGELYRHLWLMGMGLVTLNVGLTVALVKLLP